MNQFKKLAIAGAVSALMLGATSAQAHVSYNSEASKNGNAIFGDTISPGSDGIWTDGNAGNYSGNLPVNWIAHVHNDMNPNASYNVSTADAIADGANAAFKVQSHNNKWKAGSSWGAALGYGLIDMHAAGNLDITVSADTGSAFTPAFTLFSGWDTTATSSKHQSWNNTGDVTNPDTLGSSSLTYVGHSASTTSGGTTTLSLTNLAAGEYSLWVGGNGAGSTSGTNQMYTATITASPVPVPVPAAAWLMGSGILGLAGMRRKKSTA